MASNPERIFLGWERPFLTLAAERWLAHVRERDLDPARCLIVLPGSRAARRLEERLAELAPPAWAPPRVVGESELAQELRAERVRVASEWQRALAWREALSASPPAERDALWRDGARQSSAGLANLCARAARELARDGLRAADVAAAASAAEAFGPSERWAALAALEARYEAALQRRGRCDRSSLARDSAEAELDPRWVVHLFGLVDPPRALLRLLERAAVTSFVFAPESLAERFDEFGALRIEAWAEAEVALGDAQWRAVDDLDEQARETIAHLARGEPPPAPEDVAIGVPDEDALPFLERRLIEAGCEPRWAGGQSLARSRAAQLVLDALRWRARSGVEEFVRLVAHPDFEALCGRGGGVLGAALDRYVAEHAPARIDGRWATPARESVRRAVEQLDAALARARELFGPTASGAHPSAQWADALARWLTAAYAESDLEARDPAGWRHARALEALASLVSELRQADEGVAALELDAQALYELVSERVQALELPPAPGDGRPVVELFGWLELVLDDAPRLVITGVCEGALPTAGGAGLLSEAARRALGLDHEGRRVARDVWALSAILSSRPGVLLITPRHDSERGPLRPSRLLFRAPPEQVLERVRAVWPEHEAEPPPPGDAPTSYAPVFLPRAFKGALRVTDFRTYLNSPYEFYVERVLGLRSAEARVLELDPRAFGTLAHEVLELVGRDPWRACDDEARLSKALAERLRELAAARFAAAPQPAIALQVERLERRLTSFARWHARQVAQGWRVHAVEWDAPGIELEGQRIVGRIDRIERRASDGAWRVTDYKTGDSTRSPRSAHLGKGGEWTDLQLPLYRELTRELCAGATPELGYVKLSRDDANELYARFECTDEEHGAALETAREVVRAIRSGAFQAVGERAPFDASLAALCGFGLLAEDDDGAEVEEEAAG